MKDILVCLVFLIYPISLWAKISFLVNLSDKSHSKNPLNEKIYLVGSFNDWNPNDKNFAFEKTAENNYKIDVQLPKGNYEYKITRGSWNKQVTDEKGNILDNYFIKLDKQQKINIEILGWSDTFKKKHSTKSENVKVLSESYYIPSLKRYKKILIYLPESYTTGEEKYPVLYMHDGRNIFDDLTSNLVEWQVDETLNKQKEKGKEIIVVAIDNDEKKRLNEYSPCDMEKIGKGEGDQYLDFLVNDLKKHVDKNYRTKSDKKNTWIAGSSMGGLISIYASLKYPDVFGGAGIFSPSFWVCPKFDEQIKLLGPKIDSALYFHMGEYEGGTNVEDIQRVHGLLSKISKMKSTLIIRKDGRHNEFFWQKEFIVFYEWMKKYL